MNREPLSKKTCPDCHECQVCSETRCRACREDDHMPAVPTLARFFTHGDYLEWKKNRNTTEETPGASEEKIKEKTARGEKS